MTSTSRSVSVASGCAAVLALLLVSGCQGSQPRITADWNDGHQTIDGFGAATNDTNFAAPLSERVMDFFYTPAGIHLSLLRIRSFPSVVECEQDSKPLACVAGDSGTTLRSDLRTAQLAVARGATVWSSQWSPPGRMKSNGTFMKGGDFIGTPENYRQLASGFAGFVTLMAGNGVEMFALSPQNEPDMSTWYPSARWTPGQIRDFVPYLHDALGAAGVSRTKIMIAEQSTWRRRRDFWAPFFPYAAAAMNDPAVAAKVGILAAHNYDHRNPSRPPSFKNFTTQRIWQTEASSFEPYDGGIENALIWAERIHHFLSTARVNAFHYWYLTAEPNKTDNEALTNLAGDIALRAYALGHWSRFVRPGWRLVSTSAPSRLLVTAFHDPLRTQSAIVTVNTGPEAITTRFSIGRGMGSFVTPWVTSRALALKPQAQVPIADGIFTYTIPAQSVMTFASGSISAAVSPSHVSGLGNRLRGRAGAHSR